MFLSTHDSRYSHDHLIVHVDYLSFTSLGLKLVTKEHQIYWQQKKTLLIIILNPLRQCLSITPTINHSTEEQVLDIPPEYQTIQFYYILHPPEQMVTQLICPTYPNPMNTNSNSGVCKLQQAEA